MKKWNEKTTPEKGADIVSWIALALWAVFMMLEQSKGYAWADMGCSVAAAVICLCEAFLFWNAKRSIAYIAIGGLVLIVATLILQAMLLA